MINPKLLTFLKAIKKNNSKQWYDEHKTDYQVLRAEFTAGLEALRDQIATFDPAVKRGVKNGADTVKVFRIHRDTRFSKDKTKYKTNLSGMIAADVHSHLEPVYYVSIEPGGKSFIGGGLRTPDGDHLKRIRDYIATHYKKFTRVLTDHSLTKHYPAGLSEEFMLKTAPQGFPKDHPAITLLRYKNFTIGKNLSDADLKRPTLQRSLVRDCQQLTPFNTILREAGKQ